MRVFLLDYVDDGEERWRSCGVKSLQGRKCDGERPKQCSTRGGCNKRNFGHSKVTCDDDRKLEKRKNATECCAEPLLHESHKDSVKDHCHITGRYREAAHNAHSLKIRIKTKTDPIPAVFQNLRGYDAQHLMQAMSQLQKEMKCIDTNIEKCISL